LLLGQSKKNSKKEGVKPNKSSRWMRRSRMKDKQGTWIVTTQIAGKATVSTEWEERRDRLAKLGKRGSS
jgi:hypothetical protein